MKNGTTSSTVHRAATSGSSARSSLERRARGERHRDLSVRVLLEDNGQNQPDRWLTESSAGAAKNETDAATRERASHTWNRLESLVDTRSAGTALHTQTVVLECKVFLRAVVCCVVPRPLHTHSCIHMTVRVSARH